MEMYFDEQELNSCYRECIYDGFRMLVTQLIF